MSRRDDYTQAPAVKSAEVLGFVDDFIARYGKNVRRAQTAEELVEELRRWPVLAADALAAAESIADGEWDVFRAGLQSESRGEFAGEAFARRFGSILMPAAMIDIALNAARFNVPCGLMYIRMWQAEP